MSERVVVADYGIGNLLSVQRALEHCGADVERTDCPERLANADRLVVPGVGAFGNCIGELRRRNLVEAISSFARTGRPFQILAAILLMPGFPGRNEQKRCGLWNSWRTVGVFESS